jgi:hypothetical protein
MPAPTNYLFMAPLKVGVGRRSNAPPDLVGAYVECFVGAPDYMAALRLAVLAVQEAGHTFEDLVGGKVHQLDPESWPGYLARKYPQFADQLPAQPQVAFFVDRGGVFFGPFVAWESEA